MIWSCSSRAGGAASSSIGFTFAMFGLPILLLSPAFGRRIDRGGLSVFVVIGRPRAGRRPALLYTVIPDPVLAVPLILIEATGFAMFNPALFAIVAGGQPAGPVVDRPGGVTGRRARSGSSSASLLAGVAGRIGPPRCRSTSSRRSCSAFTVAAFVVGGRALAPGSAVRVEGRAA